MRADDRADVADVRADAVRVEQRGKLAGVFQTVAVADAHNLVPVGHLAQRPFREVGNRFLPAADLAADVEFTRIVNPDDRLDAKQPANHGRGLAQPPAAVQVAQVVDRDQMDHMQPHLLHRGGSHLDGASAVAHFTGFIDQQVFAAGRGEGVDADDFARGEKRGKLVACHAARVERTRKAGGKADVQHVLPGFQRGAEKG